MFTSFRLRILAMTVFVAGTAVSCKSMVSSHQAHGGIRYTIAPDQRFHRVEKGKNGSLMYDSPELTVSCDRGKLTINGTDAGPVNKGDHVEITDTMEVMVNGVNRGDSTTGYAENQQRIQQSKIEAAPRQKKH